MSTQRPAAPFRDPLTNRSGSVYLPSWLAWFRDLRTDVDAAPQTFTPARHTAETAAIGTTPITNETLPAGLYRVTWSAQIVTPAGVASSLTVSIAWTRGAISQTFSGAAITGNTVTTNQSQTLLVRIDQATPISYSTAYTSNPAATMAYDLDVVLEQLDTE